MSKLTCSLIVLFFFIFAGVDAPDYQAFAQQKSTVVKKKKKKQTAKRRVIKQKNPELLIAVPPVLPELKLKDAPYGLPSSPLTLEPSYGPGSGCGQCTGTGTGRGQGSGSGTGTGGGMGTGNGQETGKEPEIYRNPNAVNCAKGGETTPLRILSKPKPDYTAIARENQVNGSVMLRVVFNAKGEVGAVSVVKGLPFGLTEQAIAATKKIRFEPAKKCGVPVSTMRVLEYTFNIY